MFIYVQPRSDEAESVMNALEHTLLNTFLQLAGKTYNNPRNRLERLLDTNGDGSGTTDMVSDSPRAYFIQPPPGEIYVIKRINVYIEDGTNEKFDAAKYGATTELSNGIVLSIQDANGNLATLTPQAITKLGHWDLGAGIDMLVTDFPAGASDLAAVRWTFTRGGGALFLIGDNDEKLVMDVQDDLGAGSAQLVSHIAQVQGFTFRPPKWWPLNLPKAT
jgi:hypothetical protein